VRPDLITCWPRCHDYPLWREQMARDVAHFERVIIVFTSDNTPNDTRSFVRKALPFAACVESVGGADWYDDALRAGLAVSTAEWVWFAEEDYFYTEAFLYTVLAARADYDMVCSIESVRIEPSFCLVRRDVIAQNDVSFQSSGGLDNFDAFSQQVQASVLWTTPTLLGLDGEWSHMRGLSHNHYLACTRQPVTYKPDEFADYLRACLTCGVPLDPKWKAEVEDYLICCSL
jgi:hypothetical protein